MSGPWKNGDQFEMLGQILGGSGVQRCVQHLDADAPTGYALHPLPSRKAGNITSLIHVQRRPAAGQMSITWDEFLRSSGLPVIQAARCSAVIGMSD